LNFKALPKTDYLWSNKQALWRPRIMQLPADEAPKFFTPIDAQFRKYMKFIVFFDLQLQ